MPRGKTMTKTSTKVEEKTEEIKNNSIEEKVTPAKKQFDANDGILCRSVTHGKLFVDGLKTGMKYIFTDYDDETEIEYRDLVALVRARDKSVYNPRFIIMDEDFIDEYPTLNKFYTEHFSVMNIREILDMPEYQMREEISKLPKGAVKTLKTIAAKAIADGEIDSIRKIKALDEAFGTDLSLLNELLSD